jgi:hypothetical protein
VSFSEPCEKQLEERLDTILLCELIKGKDESVGEAVGINVSLEGCNIGYKSLGEKFVGAYMAVSRNMLRRELGHITTRGHVTQDILSRRTFTTFPSARLFIQRLRGKLYALYHHPHCWLCISVFSRYII